MFQTAIKGRSLDPLKEVGVDNYAVFFKFSSAVSEKLSTECVLAFGVFSREIKTPLKLTNQVAL
jgi:hypothetical protein